MAMEQESITCVLTLHLLKAVLEKIPPPPWNVGVIHLWEVDRKLPVYEIKEL
jgi:hypothetical protein